MASKRKKPEKAMTRQTTRKAKVTIAKDSLLPSGYLEVLEDIKQKVLAARIRASLSVNRELIILYWEIGRLILQRQEAEGWGAKWSTVSQLTSTGNFLTRRASHRAT
jgi:hypothetical protein